MTTKSIDRKQGDVSCAIQMRQPDDGWVAACAVETIDGAESMSPTYAPSVEVEIGDDGSVAVVMRALRLDGTFVTLFLPSDEAGKLADRLSRATGQAEDARIAQARKRGGASS